ncbi:hypothetical protein [Paucilactobacillus sp. N302-9]
MKLEFDVTIEDTQTIVTLPKKQGKLIFIADKQEQTTNELQLFVSKGHVIAVNQEPKTYDERIIVESLWTIETEFIARYFENKITTAYQEIPANQMKILTPYFAMIETILRRFGIALGGKPKATSAKARHRFDKTLINHPFNVERNGSKATVYWTKSKEMTIKKGAQLAQNQIMNKDGSIRYGTKYGEKLRADHADSIKNGQTTTDIKLRSVNEVGLFLYFGDTNGWLELVDENGRTLDELTKV